MNLRLANAVDLLNFPHKLYFVDVGGNITLGWTQGDNRSDLFHIIKAVHIEDNNREYELLDRDNNPYNLEAVVQLPRSGHWWVKVKACDPNACSEDASSFDSHTTEPIGWYLFARPIAPGGGVIH